MNYPKQCYVFDCLNLKFSPIGNLNVARQQCGVIKSNKCLWIFGGYPLDFGPKFLIEQSIERKEIYKEGDF